MTVLHTHRWWNGDRRDIPEWNSGQGGTIPESEMSGDVWRLLDIGIGTIGIITIAIK